MEVLVIFILTLLNGFFALSEIALVSSRKARIDQLATLGSRRARIVQNLLKNPENFLSSVQVGITLVGIIAGAYGGATLTARLEGYLTGFSFLHPYVHEISLFAVIGSITYFSIVIGELVPKSIAMGHAEKIALVTVPVIKYFTYATYPFVKLLSFSTRVIIKLFRIRESQEKISEEDLLFMLKTAGSQGTLEKEETTVHQNLFSFTDQTARSLMTEARKVEWIDYRLSNEEIVEQLKNSVHSKFIVAEGTIHHVKGVVTIKDFLENHNAPGFHLDQILNEPVYLTQSTPAFRILNIFRKKKQYMGIVIDEHNAVRGILTLHDLIEAIVGDLPDEDEAEGLNIIRRDDSSYLVNGSTPVYELNQYFHREVISDEIEAYATVAGYVLNTLGKIPKTGDKVTSGSWTIEIIDMDGNRIDKLLFSDSGQ